MNDLVLTHQGEAVTPAMKLNKRQRQMIRYMVRSGLKPKDAAIKAGYAEKSAKRVAYDTLATAEGAGYRQILALNKMNDLAIQSMNTAEELLDSKSDRVRMEVAQDLMDRAGMRAPDRVEHNHQGDISISINLGD